jgi:hypothetical protein
VFLELEHPFANGFAVAEETGFQPPESDADTCLDLPVAQGQQPNREWFDAFRGPVAEELEDGHIVT